ncbi:histone-like nucleoid-structuring protein Lsr2 [Nocardiopsis dassonvillei]|uniref:histone-like nucleoid-structuring protein Lsr2 n=1 Tax=Nocardiopsis dassonvillei TaxID=2014 RepID=UPI003F55B444
MVASRNSWSRSPIYLEENHQSSISSTNATKLREALAPFTQAERKASTKQSKGSKRGQHSTSTRERSSEIRAWAKAQGKPVNERGRIPSSIIEEYEATKRG